MRDAWKLIYYHEDGRYELYNLDEDPGEQHDLAVQDRATARPEIDALQRMSQELAAWLEATDAPMPVPDPQFDAAARQNRFDRAAGPLMQRLERQHANFLSPNFSPNANWWGSAPGGEE